jgi:hypothetical protein
LSQNGYGSYDHMIILKPSGSPEPIFKVSGVARTDFRGLWGRQSQFSRYQGSPGSIFGQSRMTQTLRRLRGGHSYGHPYGAIYVQARALIRAQACRSKLETVDACFYVDSGSSWDKRRTSPRRQVCDKNHNDRGLALQIALPSRPRKVGGVVQSGGLLRRAGAVELLQWGAFTSASEDQRKVVEDHLRRD